MFFFFIYPTEVFVWVDWHDFIISWLFRSSANPISRLNSKSCKWPFVWIAWWPFWFVAVSTTDYCQLKWELNVNVECVLTYCWFDCGFHSSRFPWFTVLVEALREWWIGWQRPFMSLLRSPKIDKSHKTTWNILETLYRTNICAKIHSYLSRETVTVTIHLHLRE